MTLNSNNNSLLPSNDVFVFPASYAQQRLWFLDRLESGSAFYNIANAVRLSGQLDVAVLEKSLNEIVRRQEALRTMLTEVDGKILQAIAPSLTLKLPIIELEGVSEERVQQLATEEAQRPFLLSQFPLLRCMLLRLSAQEHILLLTMHHAIADGWSIGVFLQELGTIYPAFLAGKPSPLPELPLQYADFTVWQQEALAEEVLAKQRTYWKQQLNNLSSLQLPTDRTRLAVQSFRGATQSWTISPDLSKKLKLLCQQEEVTLYMLLLTVFNTLLYRYTGQEDIAVGSAIANRHHPGCENIIGLFVNTLVMRTDVSGNPSFRELLGRVRRTTLDAYAHQDLPFDKLVDELQLERDLSRNPLFQVYFGLNNTPMPALKLGELTLNPIEIESGTSQFDLSLDIFENETELIGAIEYSTDLFDSATITRMFGHFQTLLESIVVNPQTPICQLPLLTSGEQHQLLVEFGNDSPYPPYKGGISKSQIEQCVHQLFEKQVEKSPNNIAVVYCDRQLTYQELDRRANQLAQYLQSIGVKPESKVGICLEDSPEIIIAILGVLKAGGAYIPLDPAYPQERLAFMLEDAQVAVLLTQSNLVTQLPQHNAKLICLDTNWETHPFPLPASPTLPLSASPENLAYIIYTSGSTGKPKGVMVTHGNLVNAYYAWEEAYKLTKQATCHLQMASFSFDVFTGNWIRALCSGAKLVLCPKELLLVPEKLYQLMRQEKVDCAEFFPVVIRNLMQYLEETKQSLDFMKLVIVGSDSWYVKEHQRLQKLCDRKIYPINSYGVTEATIDTTYFQGITTNLNTDKFTPIGRPFPNSQVYILDSHLQPVPIGVPGELYIGGAGVARGYFNRQELTDEKFIFKKALGTRHEALGQEKAEGRGLQGEAAARKESISEATSEILALRSLNEFKENGGGEATSRGTDAELFRHTECRPHSPSRWQRAEGEEKGEEKELISSSQRLYKTGDLARWLSDGNIEFLGRIDNQVKIRGFRLELGEIEAVLNHHSEVKEAVVIVREDEPSDKRLVAYFVGKNPLIKTNDIREFVKEKLPNYLLPSAWVCLDTFPLTPNGKIDRRALPLPDRNSLSVTETFAAPRNWIEATLVEIWSEVLDVKQVGIYDNFFELGGDSILSISAIAKANQKGLRLTPKQLFQYQAIAELATVVDTTQVIKSEQGLVTGSVPLTPIQSWFFEQNLSNPHHYNQACLLTISNDFNSEFIKQILKQLLIHHDALRLSFDLLSPSASCLLPSEESIPFIEIDLSEISEIQQTAVIESTSDRLQASLNLLTGSLLQVARFKLGKNKLDRLLIIIHHLAIDAVSWQILLEDFQTAYSQLSQGNPIRIPAKTTSFKQWAEKLQKYSHSEKIKQELNYWLQQIDDSISPLPVDFAEGINNVASTKILSVALTVKETQTLLKKIPSTYRTTIEEVLLTALGLAFAEWTRKNSLLVDLEGHGREQLFADVDISRTVGWFTSLFPVYLDLKDAKDVIETLKLVKEKLRSIPNRGIGYGLLRYLSQDELARQLQQSKAEVTFNYLGHQKIEGKDLLFELASEFIGSLYHPEEIRPCLLEIDCFIAGDRLQMEWTYSEAKHRHSTVENLAQGVLEKLRSLITPSNSQTHTYTPSDFQAAKIGQKDFNKLLNKLSKKD